MDQYRQLKKNKRRKLRGKKRLLVYRRCCTFIPLVLNVSVRVCFFGIFRSFCAATAVARFHCGWRCESHIGKTRIPVSQLQFCVDSTVWYLKEACVGSEPTVGHFLHCWPDSQLKYVTDNLPNRNLATETRLEKRSINNGLLVCPPTLQIIMLHQGWILMLLLVLGFFFISLDDYVDFSLFFLNRLFNYGARTLQLFFGLDRKIKTGMENKPWSEKGTLCWHWNKKIVPLKKIKHSADRVVTSG